MAELRNNILEYTLMERVKNKQCRICGRDEILKNNIDITTHGYEDRLRELM
jgi:hypothetical protein